MVVAGGREEEVAGALVEGSMIAVRREEEGRFGSRPGLLEATVGSWTGGMAEGGGTAGKGEGSGLEEGECSLGVELKRGISDSLGSG